MADMQAKSRRSAHGCFLGLLLVVLFALVLAPVSSASSALHDMEDSMAASSAQ
jgi:hypothetical protein